MGNFEQPPVELLTVPVIRGEAGQIRSAPGALSAALARVAYRHRRAGVPVVRAGDTPGAWEILSDLPTPEASAVYEPALTRLSRDALNQWRRVLMEQHFPRELMALVHGHRVTQCVYHHLSSDSDYQRAREQEHLLAGRRGGRQWQEDYLRVYKRLIDGSRRVGELLALAVSEHWFVAGLDEPESRVWLLQGQLLAVLMQMAGYPITSFDRLPPACELDALGQRLLAAELLPPTVWSHWPRLHLSANPSLTIQAQGYLNQLSELHGLHGTTLKDVAQLTRLHTTQQETYE